MLNTLFADARLALRGVASRPGFALMIVIPLALGIGANTAIFSAVETLLIRSAPYQDPDRLVRVWEERPRMRGEAAEMAAFSFDHFRAWRDETEVFEAMAVYQDASFNLTGASDPQRIDGFSVSPQLFKVLSVDAAIGRVFSEDEEIPGNDRVVILSFGLWQRLFGSDIDAIGETVRLDGNAHTVVGIMAPEFRFPDPQAEFWVPLTIEPAQGAGAQSGQMRLELVPVIAKLRAGVSATEAEAAAETFLNNLRETNEMERRMSEGVSIHLTSLEEQLTRQIRKPLYVLLAAVFLLLLIACANVANLLLVRSLGRESEMAVRGALGASRFDLIRKLLVESLMFSVLGGAAGVLIAHWGIRLLRELAPDGLALMRVLTIDSRVLGFTVAVSVLSALIVGLAPALRAGRVDLVSGLKGSGANTEHRHWLAGAGLRRSFAVVETALAVVLLIGAGLLVRSFVAMTEVDHGYEPKNVLTAQVVLPATKYPDAAAQRGLYERLLESMQAIPGVDSAGLINLLPISGSRAIIGLAIEGRPPVTDRSQMPRASLRVASEGYFSTMRIPIVSGRGFSEADRTGSPPVVLINESLARRYFPDEDPVGKRLTRIGEIAGVVGDVRQDGIDSDPEPEVYLHFRQAGSIMPSETMSLTLQHAPEALGIVVGLRSALTEIDRELPLAEIRSMEDRLAQSMARPKLYAWLMGAFGLLAFLMAAIGVYSVVSYNVDQRRRETGIRMALGASNAQVRSMVLRESLWLSVFGVGIGLVVAFFSVRALTQLLFEIDPLDPLSYATSAFAIVCAVFAASMVPATRAATTDVVHALRHD